MTNKQEEIIDKIESLIMHLSLTDKKNKAKGEIESIKTAVRDTKRALED